MTPDQLERGQRDGTTLVVDTRSRFEYRRGHVPGAVHVPFWTAPFRRLPVTDRAAPVVAYCGHGPRAWMARLALRARGFGVVRLLDGHFARWRREGRRIER